MCKNISIAGWRNLAGGVSCYQSECRRSAHNSGALRNSLLLGCGCLRSVLGHQELLDQGLPRSANFPGSKNRKDASKSSSLQAPQNTRWFTAQSSLNLLMPRSSINSAHNFAEVSLSSHPPTSKLQLFRNPLDSRL